jgi:hypothetical protein
MLAAILTDRFRVRFLLRLRICHKGNDQNQPQSNRREKDPEEPAEAASILNIGVCHDLCEDVC